MEIVILAGIQGSGKTTFYLERYFATHVRISLDLLKTRNRERELLHVCLMTSQPCVIDNTNVKMAERAVYIAAAKKARFRVKGYFFDSAVRDAIRRNAHRTGAAVIPVPGLLGTFKRMERPRPDEGFDELFVVTHGEDDKFIVTPWSEPPTPEASQ